MESNIIYVVLMISNAGRGEAESNIVDHEHNISNVGLHLVQQMYIVVPVSAIRQSDWLMTDQHFPVFGQ